MLNYKLNRMEIAGSLGDLGTLLPLAVGMIMVNGLHPDAVFLAIGLFYIFSGMYYQVTTPVQPMKVIGAYAVSSAITASQISASSLLVSLSLLIIGSTGLMDKIRDNVPLPVIRGVQLTTGVMLMSKGAQFIIGNSSLQKLQGLAEPYLNPQNIGIIPIGIILGIGAGALTLFFLDNKKFPAAIIVVLSGFGIGLIFGNQNIIWDISFNIPNIFPYNLPSSADFGFALLVLVLPQIPMTLGNAVIANADLAHKYFPLTSNRVTCRALCLSMSAANMLSFILGGIPMCHGAGGLAAHYRFGARTAVSNFFIGSIFIFLALFMGKSIIGIVNILPLSVLGILLFYAGSQLGLTILDIKQRNDLFIVITILGITIAYNLAGGFILGILLYNIIRKYKIKL